MEKQRDILGMLDMMIVPAFCVKDQILHRVNPAARGLLLEPGTPIGALLVTGQEEYAGFCGGCLYLTLHISGTLHSATVSRVEDLDVFVLEQDTQGELSSLALAARELREPLSRVMNSAEKLYETSQGEEALRLNRGLYQILRILGNMSDAGAYAAGSRQETINICAFIEEVFEKACTILPHAGITLRYQGPDDPIYCLADSQQLERAILNILSNAAKFTPFGGSIESRLTRQGRILSLSIHDSGSGIADELLPSLFSRYLRQPALEDPRFGLGLGMVLIRSAAANHGGTVLIDRPESGGTRITLTLAVRQSTDAVLRSPVLRVDYTGNRDHLLVELSDSLPPSLYDHNGNL